MRPPYPLAVQVLGDLLEWWDVLEIGRLSRPKVILLRGTAASSTSPALRTHAERPWSNFGQVAATERRKGRQQC